MELLKVILLFSLQCYATARNGNQRKTRSTTGPDKPLFTAVYWEVKPYIFTNEQGEADGLYPQIFANALKFCGPGKNPAPFTEYNTTKLIEFKSFRQTSRRSFMDLFIVQIKFLPPWTDTRSRYLCTGNLPERQGNDECRREEKPHQLRY